MCFREKYILCSINDRNVRGLILTRLAKKTKWDKIITTIAGKNKG